MMKSAHWVCVGLGGCATSFMLATLPYLQYLAVLLSIAAGVRAWVTGRKRKA